MSTSILDDGSLVFHLADRVVHVDATARMVYVRAPWPAARVGASAVASHPFRDVARVRVAAEADGAAALELELTSRRRLALGRAAAPDDLTATARSVADLCRCSLEAARGTARVAGAPRRFRPELDWPTGPIAADRSAARTAMGVVPLEPAAPPPRPPAGPDALHRITRELEPVRAPAAMASEPVFGALLRESQLAEALDPRDLDAALGPAPSAAEDDQQATLVGVAALGGRPAALAELLDLAAERLPEASVELPRPRLRGRSRARPRS